MSDTLAAVLRQEIDWGELPAAVAVAVVHARAPRAEPARTIRFQVSPPPSSNAIRRGSGFELSPDGRFLAFSLAGELWVRPLDSVSARRLDGVEDATYPFWSPDGTWIGFFAGGQLRKAPRNGGWRRSSTTRRRVADGVGVGLNTGAGAFSVSSTGVLAFGAGIPSDLWVQALPGGEPSRFTFGPAPGWAYPVWSPDGSELAYTTLDRAGIRKYEIHRRRADRAGAEETLLGDGEPGAATIDGRAAPRSLFPGIPSAGNTNAFMYSLPDDGQRFLVCSSKSTGHPPITVVVNWQAALGSAAAR